MSKHMEYDGVAMTCKHLGLTGEAWAVYAGWDDWYICMVRGVWANGNTANGQLCRASADEIAPYIIRDEFGRMKHSPHYDSAVKV